MRKLVAVVGPTAVGKSVLAISLADGLRGEIVSGDSRQVYRRLDIGTAKPTLEERHRVPHHLIDIADPEDSFSLSDFLHMAHTALDDIWERGLLPIITGGTGQYMWAVLEGWQLPDLPSQNDLRNDLERQASSKEHNLFEELQQIDPESAQRIDPRNVRRVVRAIEVHRATGRPLSHWRRKKQPSFKPLIIGLEIPRAELYARIDRRVDEMVSRGLLDEVQGLLASGCDPDLPAMSGIGYQEMCLHLAGEYSLDTAIERIKTHSHRLARQQATWFKRSDNRIHWLNVDGTTMERASKLVKDFVGVLAKV